jgi:hypothetical protein
LQKKLSADVTGNASDIGRMMHDRHFEEECGVLSYTWKCLKVAGDKGIKTNTEMSNGTRSQNDDALLR